MFYIGSNKEILQYLERIYPLKTFLKRVNKLLNDAICLAKTSSHVYWAMF